MHNASGWCQSLTSSMLVAILVLCFLALIVWVVIDSIYAQINKIFRGISGLITPMLEYIQTIYDYIRIKSEELKDKLEKLVIFINREK